MSLQTRALVAILLMFGFYALSFAAAFGLLWIPYAEWAYLDRVDGRIAFACIAVACIILWSIVPRRDRFQAPGPLVTASQHPQLFEELTAVAKATGQEMPRDVYLVADVNAWVSQRGGVMGIGSRRVMGLGLPLMALLSVSQFRAVIAHEFGLYHAGDTKLGPWIYRTRTAIFRTVRELSARRSVVSQLIGQIFEAYAKLYLQVTLAISRSQEYAADKLSAQIAGAKNLANGLTQIHKGAAAWESYLNTEVGPMLEEGYGPPIATGFVYFLHSSRIEPMAQAVLERELKEGKSDKCDSHPALPDRLSALQEFPDVGGAEDTRPATVLLENLQAADTEMCLAVVRDPVKPVTWESAIETVWIPAWKRQSEFQRSAFEKLKVVDLANALKSQSLATRLRNPPGRILSADQLIAMAPGTAGCMLALLLWRQGWQVHGMPGELECVKGGDRVEPFEITAKLASGEQTAEQWLDWCNKMGLSEATFLTEPTSAARA